MHKKITWILITVLAATVYVRWRQGQFDLEIDQRQRRLKKLAEYQAPDWTLPRTSIDLDTAAKNKARNVIIYNRIPKCGSETITFLFNKILKSNPVWNSRCFWVKGESHDHDIQDDTYLSDLSLDLRTFNHGANHIYIRHMPFTNITIDDWQPLWINFLRDPVSRVISDYYFRRRGPHRLRIKGQMLPLNQKYSALERNTTIEELLEGIADTPENYQAVINRVPLTRSQTMYLCGTHPDCTTNRFDYFHLVPNHPEELLFSKIHRDLAIKNIRENYIFIGILERFADSLQLLEWMFPDAFVTKKSSLMAKFRRFNQFTKNEFKTFKKPATEPWVFERLRPFFRYEEDVYQYARTFFEEKLRYYRTRQTS